MGERITPPLAKQLNLTLEPSEGRFGLKRSLENQSRKKLFVSAKEGDVEAFIQLLSPFTTKINTQTQRLSPEVKSEVITEAIRKIRIDITNIEWQGSTKFRSRLYKIVRSVIASYFRKEFRNAKSITETKKNTVTNNSNKPPRDLLTLWIEKHPDRYKDLASSLKERPRLIFEAATMDHLSMEKIKTRSGAASINAVKVTLNRVRVNLAKKAGIRLPESYKPIRDFIERGISRTIIEEDVKTREIKGVLRFLGMYYLTEQIFERHFAKKLLLKDRRD